jgi:PAS domain S-box-containing protein
MPDQKPFLSNEERIRLLDANVTDYAIFMIDTHECIASWNSGAERILGYTEDEILGQPAALIFTHEDRESGAEQKEFQTARETGRSDDERWHLRKDGSRLWALDNVKYLHRTRMKAGILPC